jgi:serine/threonine-protein kinase
LGRYHLLEQLGEGGMAAVYKAFDTSLERTVAVKVILPGQQHSEKFLQRFRREAKALASLSHPNIVKVLDFGEQDGLPYLVMEFIPGGTLKPRLGSPIPWQEAARLLSPVARALEYAHQQGIIHRDVKPANILIDEHGQPKLSDFGVAKVLEGEETLDLTGTGVGVGTPDYMAPEQGYARSVDKRADIYALGNVFYEMVTGRKPYRADTPMAVLLMKATEPLPRPSEFVPGLPEAVEYVLIKALARKPEDRYQNMGELAALLEGLAQGRVPAAGKLSAKEREAGRRSAPRGRTWARSVWAWITGGIVGLLACIAVAIGLVALFKLPSSGLAVPTQTSILPAAPEAQPTGTPSPTPTVTQEYISPIDGMELMQVPAGEFLMGVTQSDQDYLFGICSTCDRTSFYDAPQRNIYLDEYWIDRTEVTVAQFAQFVNATGYRTTAETQGWSWTFVPSINNFTQTYGRDWLHPQGVLISVDEYGQHPVVHVSWNDAAAYCAWAGRRMPTEAEWEKAARGEDGRLFPWGNGLPTAQLANINVANSGTMPVGSYPAGASPYGVQDMTGNVWEWTGGFWQENYYSVMPSENPPGPPTGTNYVFRGGSWGTFLDTELVLLSSAYRISNPAGYSNDLLGLRCVTNQRP